MSDFMKRRGFLYGQGKRIGLTQRLSEEHSKNNLMKYIPGLAHHIGVPERQILPYFYDRDWEGFINSLL